MEETHTLTNFLQVSMRAEAGFAPGSYSHSLGPYLLEPGLKTESKHLKN